MKEKNRNIDIIGFFKDLWKNGEEVTSEISDNYKTVKGSDVMDFKELDKAWAAVESEYKWIGEHEKVKTEKNKKNEKTHVNVSRTIKNQSKDYERE